jgi:hypothetical protein
MFYQFSMKVGERVAKRQFPQGQLEDIEPTKVQQITQNLNTLYSLGKPKTDTEVEDRTNLYFELCQNSSLRPGIESYCTALHISRTTLFRWAHGEDCSPFRQELILSAKSFIAAFLEQASMTGQLNPATSIFLMKNWLGYRDTVSIEQQTNLDHKNETLSVSALPKLGADAPKVIEVSEDELKPI